MSDSAAHAGIQRTLTAPPYSSTLEKPSMDTSRAYGKLELLLVIVGLVLMAIAIRRLGPSIALFLGIGSAGACAAVATESGTSPAAPVTAAPFRKSRRSTERLLDIASPYEPVNAPMNLAP